MSLAEKIDPDWIGRALGFSRIPWLPDSPSSLDLPSSPDSLSSPTQTLLPNQSVRFFSYLCILLAAIIWVIFVEWTFYLVMSMTCPDAGAYGGFHRGVIGPLKDIMERLIFAFTGAFTGACSGQKGTGTVTGNGLSERSIDVQGAAIVEEPSFPPPYSVRLLMFIFLVLLM
jgi:hypothetical protein